MRVKKRRWGVFHWIVSAVMLVNMAGCDRHDNGGLDPGSNNVLLITMDTTRADRLGCYGYPAPTSPRIDEVAASGILFDLAIAQAAITPVSHASIMTGLNPYRHGLRVIHGATMYQLEEGLHPTLASILRKKGWQTAAFVSAFTVSEYYGLDQGFDVFNTGISGNVNEKIAFNEAGKAEWEVEKNQRRADETTQEALDWLEKNWEDPFFLWLHYFDPHDQNVFPPQEDCLPFLPEDISRGIRYVDMYDAEVAYMDQQIGRVFDFLKDRGLDGKTVIIITNDHGEGLGDHDWWSHRILYQEQIRMPLIVQLPKGPSGVVIPDLVRGIDIMPTVLEYLGLTVPPMEGKSMLGLIRGEPESKRIAYADALISLDDNRPSHLTGKHNDLMYCVMSQSWKLIHRRFQSDASELYRIDQDPAEQKNVIDQYPEKRNELFEFLKTPGVMIEELIPPAQETEELRRLRELGY